MERPDREPATQRVDSPQDRDEEEEREAVLRDACVRHERDEDEGEGRRPGDDALASAHHLITNPFEALNRIHYSRDLRHGLIKRAVRT